MSDPASPSKTTTAPEAPQDAPPPRRRSEFALERRLVGAVFFAITGGITVYGAAQIHRDTFRVPAPSHPIASCSDEIGRLHTGFAAMLLPVRPRGREQLVPVRPSTDPHVVRTLAALDEDLLALRPHCEREGSEAMRAYTALTLWRHQAQDLSHLQEHMLTPDAERALRYRSPPTSSNAPQETPK